jgi:hypothetical protein
MDNKIIETLTRIETKLDAVIKALHEYDGNDEYGESSFEAFMDSKNDILNWNVDGAERIPPCVGHDKASWDEEEAERRMDIIGQNGNEGLHYDMGDSNTQDKDKRVGGKKGKRKFNGNQNKG